jgi:hypothetical protein
MKTASNIATPSLRRWAAEALKQARRLPVGPARNELRQLAICLVWLERKGHATKVLDHTEIIQSIKENLQLRQCGA